jgi:RNA-splicing ligase RtcB
MALDPRLTRLDANRLRVNNLHGVDAVLFANEQVPVEASAVTELQEIKQEAPYAYKGIGPIVRTLADAGIARPVAEVRPLMTIKG